MPRHEAAKLNTLALMMGLWVSLYPLLAQAADKQVITAAYIPLADHYAAIVAYERYGQQMQHAEFEIEEMSSWDLLRAYFRTDEVDMAFVMSPLAMDMFSEQPDFRWIGLMHRDGNALAINQLISEPLQLPAARRDRKPSASLAESIRHWHQQQGKTTEVGVPHLLSTHSVVLYSYLKQHQLQMTSDIRGDAPVRIKSISPATAPVFIKAKSNRNQPAAFEQSLPWADVVETQGFGKIAWYSRDIIQWPNGHVECLAIAKDDAITTKHRAVREVMHYIHQAGEDIEQARTQGGEALEAIVDMVRRHIPAHTRKAIIASLDPSLRVINYQHLNVDKAGLDQIMQLGLESGVIRQAIDIEQFADEQFTAFPNGTLLQEQ